MTAFALEDGVVYHTYSAYARGLDGLWGMYQWLDRAPRGRDETGPWWRRHDEYDSACRVTASPPVLPGRTKKVTVNLTVMLLTSSTSVI
jgi:hypothetical protein